MFIPCSFSGASLCLARSDDAFCTVLICPGGGYGWLSPRESEPVQRAYLASGCNAAVLRYNVDAPPLGALPLREAAWAVRMLREACGGPIFVCGFSAGGHLAASLGVHYGDPALFSDPMLCQQQRPDGLILCYPVVTSGAFAHRGSMERLAGNDPALLSYFSIERHVSPDTPPTFIWHTVTDTSVPVENALLLFDALRTAGVPTELHLFAHGSHGLSLATPEVADPACGRVPDAHVAAWHALSVGWMQGRIAGS